jgi:predicted enzyme related to lactoylglutathione lyase
MPRVVHFEIGAVDSGKIAEFYKKIFGWEISKFPGPDEYQIINTGSEGPGINGGIFKSKGKNLVVNTIGVGNVDEYIRKVLDNGGSVALEKHPIPGIGYLAYCKDIEGNLFGLIQPDTNAK